MTKPTRTSTTTSKQTKEQQPKKLTEGEKHLLETLGRFGIRAKHSSWETVSHQNDTEAVFLLREITGRLLPDEYRALMNGWSVSRLERDDAPLNAAVEAITARVTMGG